MDARAADVALPLDPVGGADGGGGDQVGAPVPVEVTDRDAPGVVGRWRTEDDGRGEGAAEVLVDREPGVDAGVVGHEVHVSVPVEVHGVELGWPDLRRDLPGLREHGALCGAAGREAQEREGQRRGAEKDAHAGQGAHGVQAYPSTATPAPDRSCGSQPWTSKARSEPRGPAVGEGGEAAPPPGGPALTVLDISSTPPRNDRLGVAAR